MRLLMAFMFWIGLFDLKEMKSFVATNEEFQEIPEDMAIPAGLHVKINLETRKREAKLLDRKDETESNAISMSVNSPVTEKKTLLSDALKNLQKERINLKFSAEELSQIKRNYREKQQNYANTFDKMRDHFHLESEIIILLIEDFLKLTNTESRKGFGSEELNKRQIEILEDFDDLLHQIDNSILFISQGGLDLLLPIVANESLPLRSKATQVLGVLTQNNPQAQKEVFNRNFGTLLIKVLITSTNSEELSIALYAFGSLIRKFPKAQMNLLPSSGIKAIVAVLNKNCELKVKAKAVNLITDLLEENKEISSTLDQNVIKNFNIYDWLEANSYCESIELLLHQEILQFLKQPDLCDNFIEAIKISYTSCSTNWAKGNKLRDALITLRNHFNLETNEYHREVAQNISDFLTQISKSGHEEL